MPPEDPAALLAAVEALGRDPERRHAAGQPHARAELTAERPLARLTHVVVRAVSD